VSLFPAISKNLKAFLYGWLPLSNAYRHFLTLQFSTLNPVYVAMGTTGAKKGEREIPCLNRQEMILQTLPGQFGDDGNL
jgi:hypothetical protein